MDNPPTEKTVEFYNNGGSILEFGTGFHQVLIDEENYLLSDTSLWMKWWENDQKYVQSAFAALG